MKAATLSEIKHELKEQNPEVLIELCLRLSKFKKENKELLTYLLYETKDERGYIESVKITLEEQLLEVNRSNYYFIKKGLRKILRTVKRYARYSSHKETEIALLIFCCAKFKAFDPSIRKNQALVNLYNREIDNLRKKILVLNEDLQYDYGKELEDLLI